MGWLAQHFFNPSFVLPWGALLLTIPIIIHLINRMRYRRVRFAAMEFLLQSQKKNRRRLLLEQLLLLLLRLIVVGLLIALIARLVVDPSEMALFQGAQSHHIVLLDDSGSMREQLQEEDAFQAGLDVVRELAAEGGKRPNTIQLSLLRLSNPSQPILYKQTLNEAFLNELETRIENLKCGYGTPDLRAGLEAAGVLFKQDEGMQQYLHFISDFRDADWLTPQPLAEEFQKLDNANVSVNLIRTTDTRQDNLGLTGLEGDVHVAAAGVPVRLKATVNNFGETGARNVRLSVFADGEMLPMSLELEQIDAGEEQVKEFDVTLPEAGKHQLEVRLEEDVLSADNRRYLALDLSQRVSVLIIDGSPTQTGAEYVADALAADSDLTGIDVRLESPEFLRLEALDQFACIYLLDLGELSLDAVAALQKYVEQGGGIAWFLGQSINPVFYNDKLSSGEPILFPVPLEPTSEALVELDFDQFSERNIADLQFETHPIFKVMEGQDNPFVDMVRVETYYPVQVGWEPQSAEGVKVIARLRNGAPFALEHQLSAESGKIISFLSTAGPEWNNWSLNPSYVIFQLELQKYIARKKSESVSRNVGEPIDLSLPAVDYMDQVDILVPEETGKRRTRIQAVAPTSSGSGNSESTTTTGDILLTAKFDETSTPGVYQIELLTQNQVKEERWIAYNVPARESRLDVMETGALFTAAGEFGNIRIHEPGELQGLNEEETGQDVRKFLLIALLLFLLAEQAMAYHMSYHPQSTKTTR
ncbi:MAG: BatA domain-containing protein [Planctomycetaceae bacterium]|nr:BatA domain-containing protein [Planctomycetaceae bacterium]